MLTILKSISNPLVQCRACRLLGNLAKENPKDLILHSDTITHSICMIIDEERTDIQTILMAIRVAKFLLNDKLFLKNFINEFGFRILIKILIKLIKNPNPNSKINANLNNDTNTLKTSNPNENDDQKGLKLFKQREKYFDDVARTLEGVRSDIFDLQILKGSSSSSSPSQKVDKYKEFVLPEDKIKNDVICEIFKCLLIISESKINPLELYKIGSIGISSLVFFIDDDNHNNRLYRSYVLKILSNFSCNPILISALCSADVIGTACKLFTQADNLSK